VSRLLQKNAKVPPLSSAADEGVIRKIYMNDPRETKKWKAIEVQINQASEFLYEPKLFELKEQSLENYKLNTRENELKQAMLTLENIAKVNGCKSGFWRRLQKAATNMGEQSKVEEYEKEFHSALSKNV